jgi:integrase
MADGQDGRLAMRRTKGEGCVYQPRYKNKRREWVKQAVWWIKYQRPGEAKPTRESAHTTRKGEALGLLRDRLSDIKAGLPTGPDVNKTTFEDLARLIEQDYEVNERDTLVRVKQGLEHLRGMFAGNLAVTITGDRTTAYALQRKAEGAANATINRELAALKRAFRLAAKMRKVAFVPAIDMLREDNARRGFFESEQFAAVLAKLPVDLKPLAEAAYITGWRGPSDLQTRQWKNVDFRAGWLRLEPGETKNGEGRMFPLTPELRAVLEAQRARTDALEQATGRIIPWVFWRVKGPGVREDGQPVKSFRKAWARACREAGVPGRLAHDFRRTAVRNLERAGVPRSVAMKLTGHKTEAVYRRYAIVAEQDLREGAAKLAALHESLTAQPAQPKVVGIRSRKANR